MGLLVVKIFPCVVDLVVKTRNFKTLFLIILRPLLFPRESTLQHFKKLRRFYENAVTGCQKLGQPNVNPDGITVRSWIGNADITLQGDRCVPIVSFPQDSHLLDYKPGRDRSMQVDWNCSNFGQLNVQGSYWILLELGKQQRLEPPVFLESGKAESSF